MKQQILVFFFLLASAFMGFFPAKAETPKFPAGNFAELRQTGTGTVKTVINPQTVQLGDGRILSLTGLDFPDFNPYQPGELALMAVEVLRDMLEGQEVILYQTQRRDWGRVNSMRQDIAHLERKSDKAWIQGTLLSLGLARVYTSQRNPEMAAQMYKLEQDARTKKLGLWENGTYKIMNAQEAALPMDRLQIVEGLVHSAALKTNNVFLNFGPDWRTDFTVAIKPGDKKLFVKKNIDPLQLNGKHIRVRGWVRSYNGPFMEIDHPEALEILDENFKSQPLPDAPEGPMVKTIDANN